MPEYEYENLLFDRVGTDGRVGTVNAEPAGEDECAVAGVVVRAARRAGEH